MKLAGYAIDRYQTGNLEAVGRPRQFDEDAVLDAALDLFWRNGYAATSLRDLTEALGVAPTAIYRTFGDKHTLFLRALDRYVERETDAMGACISRSGSPISAIASWLAAVSADLCADPDGKGCFLVNAATELGATDDETRSRARAAFTAIAAALETTIRRAQAADEARADLDPAAAAELVLAAVLGMRVRGRVDPDRAATEELVGQIVASLT